MMSQIFFLFLPGCVNVSYLPAPRYGVSATFSIDGKVYINETVSGSSRVFSLYNKIFILYQVCHQFGGSMFKSARETKKGMVRLCEG